MQQTSQAFELYTPPFIMCYTCAPTGKDLELIFHYSHWITEHVLKLESVGQILQLEAVKIQKKGMCIEYGCYFCGELWVSNFHTF